MEKFGLIVEFLPGKEGLVHISELDMVRVDNLDKWAAGDSIDVMLLEARPSPQACGRKVEMKAPCHGAFWTLQGISRRAGVHVQLCRIFWNVFVQLWAGLCLVGSDKHPHHPERRSQDMYPAQELL